MLVILSQQELALQCTAQAASGSLATVKYGSGTCYTASLSPKGPQLPGSQHHRIGIQGTSFTGKANVFDSEASMVLSEFRSHVRVVLVAVKKSMSSSGLRMFQSSVFRGSTNEQNGCFL